MSRWRSLTHVCGLATAIVGTSAAPAAEKRPLVIAHRGGALLRPENTIPAFDYADKLGVDVIEFDIMMTKDHQLVITHDSKINSSFCNAEAKSGVVPAPIRNLTLAEVRTFDCGSRHRASYAGQKAVPGARMPTLDAVLARYRRRSLQLFGEIKMPALGDGDVDPTAFTTSVAEKVRRHGLEDRFILQSFDWRTIDAMHEINPRIRTCLLGVERAKANYLSLAQEHHARCVVVKSRAITIAEVQELKAANILIFSDVVDDQAGWADYLSKDFDALFTNDPESAIKFVDSAVTYNR